MLKYRKITTFGDLRKAYRLRYDVFVQEVGYTPNGKHDLEVDCYDAHSMAFGAFDGSRCVGCVRLVLDSEIGLPLEKIRSVDRRGKNIAELSRLAIHPDYRHSGALSGLLVLARQTADELEIDTVYAVRLKRIKL